MGLKFAVITSVIATIGRMAAPNCSHGDPRDRHRIAACGVEVLIPDFRGISRVETVMEARPDVLNHNTETVPPACIGRSVWGAVRGSLGVLAHAKACSPATPTKSGLMLGLVRPADEVLQVMRDLAAHHVNILTLGAVSAALAQESAIVRYVTPEEFDASVARSGDGLRAR